MLLARHTASTGRRGRATEQLAQVNRAGRFADRAESRVHLAWFLLTDERVEALEAEGTIELALGDDDSHVALDGR